MNTIKAMLVNLTVRNMPLVRSGAIKGFPSLAKPPMTNINVITASQISNAAAGISSKYNSVFLTE
jgi:hypothetical protein